MGLETPGRGRPRRVVEVCLFVGVWMFVGFVAMVVLGGGSTTYVLVGVPLTLLFQRLVRRQPLRALWLRDAPRLYLDPRGRAIALVLIILPGYYLVDALMSAKVAAAVWNAAALGGACAAAYAIQAADRATVRSLRMCLVTAGSIGIAWLVLGFVARPYSHVPVDAPLQLAWSLLRRLVYYVAVGFALEEPAFRGALDPHVQHPGEGRPWASAILISCLWAIWHLPLMVGRRLPSTTSVVSMLAMNILVGIGLSFHRRRSGNLAVPVTTRAFLDAVRDAMGLIG